MVTNVSSRDHLTLCNCETFAMSVVLFLGRHKPFAPDEEFGNPLNLKGALTLRPLDLRSVPNSDWSQGDIVWLCRNDVACINAKKKTALLFIRIAIHFTEMVLELLQFKDLKYIHSHQCPIKHRMTVYQFRWLTRWLIDGMRDDNCARINIYKMHHQRLARLSSGIRTRWNLSLMSTESSKNWL